MKKSKQSDKFDLKIYHSTKKKQKLKALFFSILGGMIILDSAAPIPFPLIGFPSVLVGIGSLLYGYWQYQAYITLPLHEALQLGKERNGEISRSDLFLNFKLTPDQTDQLIEELIQKGFIEPIDSGFSPEPEIRYRLI